MGPKSTQGCFYKKAKDGTPEAQKGRLCENRGTCLGFENGSSEVKFSSGDFRRCSPTKPFILTCSPPEPWKNTLLLLSHLVCSRKLIQVHSRWENGTMGECRHPSLIVLRKHDNMENRSQNTTFSIMEDPPGPRRSTWWMPELMQLHSKLQLSH